MSSSDMWVFNTPSQVVNERVCWFFTVRATGRCRRRKMGGHVDGVVPVAFAGVVSSIDNTFSPKIFELALCVAAF